MKSINLLFIFSIFTIAVTVGPRFYIFVQDYPFNTMTARNFFIGFCYDLMNMSIISVILGIFLIGSKSKNIILFLIYLWICFIIFIDYHYYLQFGSHLPYKSIFYLTEIENFSSSIKSAILSPSFILIFVAPVMAIFFLLKKIDKYEKISIYSRKKYFIYLLIYFIIGGVSGSYGNSALGKNINDPVTVPLINYFIWSKEEIEVKNVVQPIKDIKFIEKNLLGSKISNDEFKSFPLVRFHDKFCNQKKSFPQVVNCGDTSESRNNVILILVESFRAVDVGIYGGLKSITPRFDELSKEGILFKNFYANGHQTKHGQVASYCSVVPNYGVAIMDHYSTNSFYCLPEFLKDKGYSTSWIHAADSSFDGQAFFFLKNGFNKIFDRNDFTENSEKLGWGFSDEELFNKALDVIKKEDQPFFGSILTITNHHPFEVPEEFNLNLGSREVHKFLNTLHYSDKQLGTFIDKAKKQKWYENTIIIITGDTSWHGESLKKAENFDEFVDIRSKIPLLIIGGPIKISTVVEEFGSQIDIAPTIADLLNLPRTTPWMGSSLLVASSNSFAFTNRPSMYWSVMSSNGRFHLENDQIPHLFGEIDEKDQRHYEILGNALINTTKWLLQENLYWPSSIYNYN